MLRFHGKVPLNGKAVLCSCLFLDNAALMCSELENFRPQVLGANCSITEVSRENGHEKPEGKALEPACQVVMFFDTQNALRKYFVLEENC